MSDEYDTIYDKPASLWFVTYGEALELPEPDPDAPPPRKPASWLRRLRRRLKARAEAAVEFYAEVRYRVCGAWTLLRTGRFYG